MSRRIWTISVGLVVALLFSAFFLGCSPAANLLAMPALPSGTYWNVEGYFGDSELKFLDGSHYTIGGIGAVTAEGRYTLTRDQIVLTEYGPADAPCLHLPGVYSWKLKGKFLTLRALDDPCSSRALDWATGVWEFMPPATVVNY